MMTVTCHGIENLDFVKMILGSRMLCGWILHQPQWETVIRWNQQN